MLYSEDFSKKPHSIEAEQAVLGGIIVDNEAFNKIVDIVDEKDFYRHEHRIIFESIRSLINERKNIDALILSEKLKSAKNFNHENGSYLYSIERHVPSAANIVNYAQIVREYSILRQLIDASVKIAQKAYNHQGQSSSEILNEVEQYIFAINKESRRNVGPCNVAPVAARVFEKITDLYENKISMTGISTGFHDFDRQTSGLQKGELIIVAGRPSMGKTAFAVNIGENVVLRHNRPVLLFSMEMPAESLVIRLISSMSRIDQMQIRNGKINDKDWARVMSSVSLISQMMLFIDDTPALSSSELASRARRLAAEQGGLDLIIVDYLQLMHLPGFKENRSLEISAISSSLKSLAKELQVPIIVLSQLNRSLEQRGDKRPIMSDLRESGAIEQDADLIIFIYRDEVYNEDSKDKGKAEIIIAKQRNGPIGKHFLTFLGKYTRFENFTSHYS